MNPKDFNQLRTGLNTLYWEKDFSWFCNQLSLEPDDRHAEDKYQAFQALAQAMQRLEPREWQDLVNAAMATAPAAPATTPELALVK